MGFALHRYIPMAILGKYDELLSIPQVFHIPLLYKYREIQKCEGLHKKFSQKVSLIC